MITKAKQNEFEKLTLIWENGVRASCSFLSESDINFFRPKILNECLYAIKNHNINKLDVNEQNPNAVNFYKYMGFEVVNRSETDSFGKPFPLLHMRLNK